MSSMESGMAKVLFVWSKVHRRTQGGRATTLDVPVHPNICHFRNAFRVVSEQDHGDPEQPRNKILVILLP